MQKILSIIGTDPKVRILGPGLGKKASIPKFVDIDHQDEKIIGIASGHIHPFPERDDNWVNKFDYKWKEEQEIKQSNIDLIQDETFADIFIHWMNHYEFDQQDMINPDDKVDYTLYLKNVERTISEKLEAAINIFGAS